MGSGAVPLIGLALLSCSKRNESAEALEAALHAASDFAGEIPVETYIDEIAFEGEMADRTACASPGYYDIVVTSETERESSAVMILAQRQQWSIEAYCDSLSFGAAVHVQMTKVLAQGASMGEAHLSGSSGPEGGKYCRFDVTLSFDRKTGSATVVDGEFCDRDARKAGIDWAVPVFLGEHLQP